MADKRIDELEEATSITANDLFVLEQANTAKKLSGQTMTTFLTALANGHGGINNIQKTSSTGTNPVIDTYTITYADASTSTFTVTNGKKGDQGIQGVQGPAGADITITNATVEYQSGVSGVTAPTGTWQSTVPSVMQGNYLWTRVIVNYSDGTGVTSYSVSRMGVDGSGSVSSVNDVSPDGNGNVALTASDIGALPDSYTPPVTSVNTKTGTVALTASDVGAVPKSGSNGFLYRNNNNVSQKQLMTSLWSDSSGWESGDISVPGITNYKMFLVRIDGQGTMILAILGSGNLNGQETYFRGIGGFSNATSGYNYYVAATLSGTTLTMVKCESITEAGAHTDRKVIEIIGVI